MFLHVSVILLTGGLRAGPPWQGEPPRTRQTPPPDQADPPGADTPPGPGRPPSLDQAESPGSRHPPGPGRQPPWEQDCSIRSMSGRYAYYWNAFLSTCALMQKKVWDFNYRHFRNSWSQLSLVSGGSRIFLRGAPSPKLGVITYFFAANYMKMKEFGLREGAAHPWRPLRSASVRCYVTTLYAALEDAIEFSLNVFTKFSKFSDKNI